MPPDDAATHYELGIAYREMGLYDDAVAEFDIARTRIADAEYMRALTLDESGRHVEAIQVAAISIAAGVANMRHVAEVMLRRLPRGPRRPPPRLDFPRMSVQRSVNPNNFVITCVAA